MSKYRKYQFLYIATDAVAAMLVWLCFLLFRWLVYEGKVFGIDTVLIPAFDFYRPLFLYPAACLIIHYLSGYYIRPLKKTLTQEFLQTLCSAVLISLGSFFVIILDDPIAIFGYHRYIWSLGVLFLLQFGVNYVLRLTVTLSLFTYGEDRVFTLHSLQEVDTFYAANAIRPFDRIIIDLPEDNTDKMLYTAIRQIYPSGVAIDLVPKLHDILLGSARIGELNSTPLINVTSHKMMDWEICVKRAFDVLAAMIILIICSPVLLAISIAISISSPGGIIYRQERIGLYGRRFNILKFRTMIADSEGDIPQLSQDDDPRVTPVGYFLRKYRLDELPQMINIIRGEMSFVGPRPEREFFIKQIEAYAPYYCLLYKIRPGMTSWGPIRVGYTDTMDKMLQRLQYDIAYMENMSLGLDIKILLHTIRVILDGRGK